MKIRIGYGLGTQTAGGGSVGFAALVDALERHRFDSLWLSERISGGAVDPVVGLAVAAGRTTRLKLGFSVLVLPGRNPALLAKELASLDHLSGGRLLPAFGLGVANPAEQQAFGVARNERAALFEEALPLLRRFWTGEPVDHDGARYHYDGLRVLPRPVQDPLEVWLGGAAPAELRRVGRHGDGWLPSFCTPESAVAGRVAVVEAADAAGRAIDEEHWGALVPYTTSGSVPDAVAALVAARSPGVDPARVVPASLAATRALLEDFVAVGFSKFVLVPLADPGSWDDELAAVAAEILPLQTGSKVPA